MFSQMYWWKNELWKVWWIENEILPLKKNFNLEKIPPTSASIHKHIQPAFCQSHIWYNSCFCEVLFLDPLDYDYALINKVLMPDFEMEIVPENFSLPYSCPGLKLM